MNKPNSVPVSEIVALTRSFVRIPSRAGEDDPAAIVKAISGWAKTNNLNFHKLVGPRKQSLGGYFHFDSGKQGPTICLNACIDTSPYGDLKRWHVLPSAGVIEENRLYGRGSADSKIAASIFCHVFRELSSRPLEKGQLYVLLDADEHSGNFGGVKAFLKSGRKPDAVYIGYPGNTEIFIGARGFLRAVLTVSGEAAHSGSRRVASENALLKAAALVDMLGSSALPAKARNQFFTEGPKITVTGLHCGRGFSQVPDRAVISVDMRLTPDFDQSAARAWLDQMVHQFDEAKASKHPTNITYKRSWPAYVLNQNDPIVAVLQNAAERELRVKLPLHTCGPSNIGNFLATQNIPAVCGFGVDYAGAHATDEYVNLNTIAPVYRAYRTAVRALIEQRL